DSVDAINTYEVGGYAQLTRKLFDDKLTLVASGRFDKNENFKNQFTPRAAALIQLAKNHNLRMSYQTAYRFPGNLSQWIRLNVGNITLLGGLPWVLDYMNVKDHPVIDLSTNAPLEYKPFKPETMRSFELGYKGLISNKLMLDMYGYVGNYKDFIGRIGLFQPSTRNVYSIVVNSANKVKTHGWGIGLNYDINKAYSAFVNVYSDVITDVPAGFKAYFNAPKYKLNAGLINNGFGKEKRASFSVMLHWQDWFNYEGELANGPVNAFTTVDAQVSYKFPKIKSQVRIGGTNIFNKYYKNAYGHPEVGGLYYVGFAYNFL
ncbi:MAG TPA: TonB-dependent receptor, partial [Chitinophagaceae bacterium]